MALDSPLEAINSWVIENLSCIGSTEFKTFSEERVADRVMFHSRIKASMIRGDLLGHVLLVPGE
ncbi:MAG: hypothetical protein ACFFEF_13760 [Candidatus Thorarchaeota archaeon]